MITCLTNFKKSLNYLGLCSGSKDRLIKLWDIGTSKNYCSLNGHSAAISCVDVIRNGDIVASGSKDKTVRV